MYVYIPRWNADYDRGMNVWSVWIYKTLNSLIDWSKGKNADLSDFEGKRRGRQRMRWLDVIIDALDMSLSKLQETAKVRKPWHAAAHGVTQTQIQLSDWTTKWLWRWREAARLKAKGNLHKHCILVGKIISQWDMDRSKTIIQYTHGKLNN